MIRRRPGGSGPRQPEAPRPRPPRERDDLPERPLRGRPEPPVPAEPPPPLHLAVLYGEVFTPFVGPIIVDLVQAAHSLGHELVPLSIEHALLHPARRAVVDRLYVLPFDPPEAEAADGAAALVKRLFPRADVLNSMEAHEICWDKLRTEERFVARGVQTPETLFTQSPDEVREFAARHEFVLLKERRGCGGQGHVVLCDSDEVLVGEGGGRRFVVELGDDPSQPRRLADGILTYPPPFLVQRMVGKAGPAGTFTPGQILRAYVVDGRVAFWAERYREHYRRPSDWIVNVDLGARYRFVLETSAELRKTALHAAGAVGMRIGAVDIVRSGAGTFVLEADCDGRHMYIDRSFKEIPDFRLAYDLDRMIAASLALEEIPALAGPL